MPVRYIILNIKTWTMSPRYSIRLCKKKGKKKLCIVNFNHVNEFNSILLLNIFLKHCLCQFSNCRCVLKVWKSCLIWKGINKPIDLNFLGQKTNFVPILKMSLLKIWTPPTPPRDGEVEHAVDYTTQFLYEKETIPENHLPPTHYLK